MRTWKRAVLLAAGGVLIAFFVAFPSLAAEPEEHASAHSTAAEIFHWLNFALIAGAVVYLIAKQGRPFFRANAHSIRARIDEAAATRAHAERALREIEAKMARLDKEIAELREEGRRQSATEAKRLRESGLVEIEKIRQAACGELASSERAARQQLRALAASMAVERAGALVNSRMDAEVRARIFHSFVGELGRSAN
jgi:F-type H+-transporting ATPase subunit b